MISNFQIENSNDYLETYIPNTFVIEKITFDLTQNNLCDVTNILQVRRRVIYYLRRIHLFHHLCKI